MSKVLQAVRGMNDILPEESCYWAWLEDQFRLSAQAYHYQEVRLPLLEATELFARGIGDATDIVEKEMYTFADRNGDSLTLRPEGTAGVVRAGIEHGLLYHQIQRLWYIGPMFRHERPQKGRYRQFYQLGVEAFGLQGPEADVEVILLSQRFLHRLGLADVITLELNTLGTSQARAVYREALVTYLQQHHAALDEDSQRRLHTNPLRILDSKNPAMQGLIQGAPKLLDYLDEASQAHFARVKALLDAAGVRYVENPRLVRGLDYYCFTVFEWVTTHLGAQGTVCAGGRYDGLVETLGGPSTPAVGFACGLERLVLLLKERQSCQVTPQVFMILVGDAALQQGLVLAERLRTELPTLRLEVNLSGGSFKNQFKRADKSGAQIALIMGDDELAKQTVGVKYLQRQVPQQEVSWQNLTVLLKEEC